MLFLKYADESNYTPNEIQLIDLIISSTRIGYNFDLVAMPELIVMHDLDWSGFNDYEIFKENCEKICREAIDVGKFEESVVRQNQINFYRKFAEKPLYITKTFSKFNDIAKENMLKLANELEFTLWKNDTDEVYDAIVDAQKSKNDDEVMKLIKELELDLEELLEYEQDTDNMPTEPVEDKTAGKYDTIIIIGIFVVLIGGLAGLVIAGKK